MAEGPKNSLREKKERRIAAEAEKRKEKRAEAMFALLQEEAAKAHDDRQGAENEKQVERRYRRKQTAIAKLQLKTYQRLNCITVISAVIAVAALAGVIWNVVEARFATVEANRAWIAPADPYFKAPPIVGKPVDVIIPYQNVGRAPATNMRKSTEFDVIDAPEGMDFRKLPVVPNDFCTTNPPQEYSGVVFPGKGDSFFIVGTDDQNIVWDPKLESEAKFLRVRGCISYQSFGKPHRSWWCAVLSEKPPAGIKVEPGVRVGTSCPSGDGAD